MAYNDRGCFWTPEMVIRLFGALWLAVLAGTWGLRPAHADIYTWVDASGTINVSNLAPPDGVSVTNVIHESTPAGGAADNTARDAAREAQVQALTMRVGQLEDEVEFARRQVPPPVVYPVIPPPPPMMQYVADLAPPPMEYGGDSTPPAFAGCDPSWAGCGAWWVPSYYPVSAIVLRGPNFGRNRPVKGGHRFVMQPAAHAPASFRRG